MLVFTIFTPFKPLCNCDNPVINCVKGVKNMVLHYLHILDLSVNGENGVKV